MCWPVNLLVGLERSAGALYAFHLAEALLSDVSLQPCIRRISASEGDCAATNIVKYRLQNPEPHRERFQQNCFVVVPEALPTALVKRWRKQAQAMTRYARTVTRREAG